MAVDTRSGEIGLSSQSRHHLNGRFEGIDKSARAELRPGSRTCQCADCEEFFTGVAPFDNHLADKGTANPKCRSAAEMEARDMVRNRHGVWQGK